ncbi:MAG: SDR family NAD(P)-dependent oxidoreductase [Bacteroidales bacterium]
MRSDPRRTALVTGASAGIGVAIADEFARHGFDLVLTARREDRLRAVASDLAARHGVQTRIIVADLADPAAPARVCAEATAGGRPIDALVNNAGYGLGGGFLDVTWEQHARFIQVMMTAVVELTYRFLPGMIERRYGRILNVASLAGLVPGTAGHTLYGASKSFVIKFSQSVGLEAAKHNVRVTALCPGFTYSEFHDVNGTRELVSRLPKWMWMQAAPVAREGYAAVMRGDLVRVPGTANRVLAVLARIMPERVVLAATKRQARNFRRVGR